MKIIKLITLMSLSLISQGGVSAAVKKITLPVKTAKEIAANMIEIIQLSIPYVIRDIGDDKAVPKIKGKIGDDIDIVEKLKNNPDDPDSLRIFITNYQSACLPVLMKTINPGDPSKKLLTFPERKAIENTKTDTLSIDVIP